MLKYILICFITAFPGVVTAFDGTFPIDTFYNPIMSQNAAWSSLNYVNSYNNIGNPVRSYIDNGGGREMAAASLQVDRNPQKFLPVSRRRQR